MREISFLSGNIGRGPDPGVHGPALSYSPRRLVEECVAVTTADLRRVFGRKALLTAVNDARPIKFQLEGHWHEIYVLTEPHHLPRRDRRTLDDTLVRIWISCPQCRHRARKLYTFPLVMGSPFLADLRCRKCHNLVYQSQHCGGNRWWREIARPLKRLLRKRQQLLGREQTAKIMAQIEEVDQQIWIMRQRAKPKARPGRQTIDTIDPQPRKRPYRDISLIE